MSVGSSSSIVSIETACLEPWKLNSTWDIGVAYSSLKEGLKLKQLTDEECETCKITIQRVEELRIRFASSAFIQNAIQVIDHCHMRWGISSKEDVIYYKRHYQQFRSERQESSNGRCLPGGRQPTVLCTIRYSSKARQLVHRYSADACNQLYPTKHSHLYMQRIHDVLAKHGLELRNFLGSAYDRKNSS